MATTNLISNSLGTILCQSGFGVPDHSASKGSIYTDTNTGYCWKNVNGSNSWSCLKTSAYGELLLNTNTDPVNAASTNIWYSARNLNYRTGSENGVVRDSGALRILSGYSGIYLIELTSTVQYSLAATNASIGISINGNIPLIYSTGTLNASKYTRSLPSSTIVSLNNGDLIYIVYSLSVATRILLIYANIIIKKMSY